MKNNLLISLILLFSFMGCCSFQKRKSISESMVSFSGGVYGVKEWSSDLNFKRFSWYHDATLKHDYLITKLEEENDFRAWLGSDLKKVAQCPHLYVFLLYGVEQSDTLSILREGLKESGYQSHELILTSFDRELQSHGSFQDWELKHHVTYGYCLPRELEMELKIPGFKQKRISNI